MLTEKFRISMTNPARRPSIPTPKRIPRRLPLLSLSLSTNSETFPSVSILPQLPIPNNSRITLAPHKIKQSSRLETPASRARVPPQQSRISRQRRHRDDPHTRTRAFQQLARGGNSACTQPKQRTRIMDR